MALSAVYVDAVLTSRKEVRVEPPVAFSVPSGPKVEMPRAPIFFSCVRAARRRQTFGLWR
jgi:hypothetical protein